MTDEELHQLIERDNLARRAVSHIEHLALVSRKRRPPPPAFDLNSIRTDAEDNDRRRRMLSETALTAVRVSIAGHELLAAQHGVKPLPKKARKVAGEPEGLPDDLLAAYRGLKQRIREAEHITLSPTPIRCGADVPV